MSPETQVPLSEETLPAYLVALGIVPEGETVSVEGAGEGNINWVRRARLASGESWIVKQARPALERFPEYRVSTERIRIEARYFETVAPLDSEGLCPEVRHFDEPQRVLVLEDIRDAERFDRALARGPALDAAKVSDACRAIGRLLGAVHRATRNDASVAERFANDEMRRLHGEHIFALPFRPNDFPLAPSVAARAAAIQNDRELIATLEAAHARYLEPRGALVHADVQPTNLLLAGGRTRLLDPEIAHIGDPAFDVGIFVAHLILHGIARGEPQRSLRLLTTTWSAYEAAHGPQGGTSFADVMRHAGIEMLRRTIGAARTPECEQESTALAVLDRAPALVRDPPVSPRDLAGAL